ncbi:hypothetical protein ABW20_dc0104430 [Dactylellina cionopaga]|nr:hypothetical protein ABW20_dc0104430 [Dactylellina cionopaga]
MDYQATSGIKPMHSEDTVRQMLSRESTLSINISACEPVSSEILGTNTTIGHLPNETRVVIQVLHNGPMSLLNNNFFRRQLHGKSMPWLNGQEIYFPEADKYKPASYVPMRDDQSEGHDYGVDMGFRRPKGGATRLRVWGIAEVPIIIGGIPLRISCLLVDCLPIHRVDIDGQMPDMLILASFLNGKTVPLRYHINLVHYQPRVSSIINTCVVPESGNIALEVYADVANPKSHKRGGVYDFGYGVWFAEDSVFNANGTMESRESKPDYFLELRGALQTLYAVRDLCIYHYSAFDFTDVMIYCSSHHIVQWAEEWTEHWETKGWMASLKLDNRAKNLWDEIMNTQKVARRTFRWKYLEPKHNDEASTLATTAVMGMKSNDWSILMNESSNVHLLRQLLKPKQRPGKYFQGLSLEGGMCRKNHPRGFIINTCCMCSSGKKGWEKYFHF